MLIWLVNLFSMCKVVFKRLRHNLGIAISALIGIVAVLSMVVCVPVFSYSVSSNVLKQELEAKVETTHRHLFSLHLYFLDSRSASVLSVEKSTQLTNIIRQDFTKYLGLKPSEIITEMQSGALNISAGGSTTPGSDLGTAWKTFRFLSNEKLPQIAQIVDGAWPTPDTSSNGPVQVAISEVMADDAFMNLGDRYKITDNLEIQVAGIWRPINVNDPNWFDSYDVAYTDKLWVPLETYRARVQPAIPQPVFYTAWYIVASDNSLNYQLAPQYSRGITRLSLELNRLLPGTTIDYSPQTSLIEYEKRAATLTTLFYAVGAPMLILALMFISLTARIAVQQYEQETATMRGRGTSWIQIAFLNLTESIILVIISVPIALVTGWLAASLVGQTVSFLKFTARPWLPFEFIGLNILWLVIAVVIIVGARFFPVLSISRTTIVRMKQEQTRGGKKPFWERFYLDFLLLIPGIYAFLIMRGIAKPAKFLAQLASASNEQYRDPLLFIAPALFAMAVCMIMLRIVPLIMRLLSAIIDRLPGAWAYLSLQQITRRPQDHASALLLIMISLSLSIFSASTAKTLDKWLYDSVYYRVGADWAIHEFAAQGGTSPAAYGPPSASSSSTTLAELDMYTTGFVSLDDHLRLPSITGGTRVGLYAASFSYGIGESGCLIMGIDRLDFPKVAFYRDDFASQSEGALMNELGAEPMGVLIPSDLAKSEKLRNGDQINVSISAVGQTYERILIVVGTYDYFPTIYPSNTPTLIVNLDSIFDNPDDAIAYDLWFNLRPKTDMNILTNQIRQMIGQDIAVIKERGNAPETIKTEQAKPERVGMFGILNVGFIATGLMPGIGFVLYSYASLRRRFIQLGILQAIGLSVKQLIGYLVTEQFLLMGIAISSGAGLGLLTCYLFVPFLQVGAAPGSQVPPFKVLIGWAEAGWLSLGFSAVLFLTTLGTVAYLARLKVFQAVKMGETL
jgi:putative ABC transport system permease protein